ncbi:MAG: ribonuclease PH [Dehalococcoidia bacterium]
MARIDGRRYNELRPVRITPGYLAFAEGSCLIETGQTRVLCAATLDERVPPFLKGKGTGWVTAEYSMLPRSTETRTRREASEGRIGGRTHEIQRLIGRSLRAITALESLGERSITIDCDVIQADGGTRTAAITGAYVALCQASEVLRKKTKLTLNPIRQAVAATSIGIVGGKILLDLCYPEDSRAAVDFNVVMTDQGRYVEVQGTAEQEPFERHLMDEMLSIATAGIEELFQAQRDALSSLGIETPQAAQTTRGG